MSSLQCHHSQSQSQRPFMRREVRHTSLRSLLRDMLLPHLSSLIRKARGPCLQQLGEYYLHNRWKGSRHHHLQVSECYLHTRWKGPRVLHQQYGRENSPRQRRREPVTHRLTSLILMLAPPLKICMRSSDRERRKTACYSRSSTWPNGQ